MIGPNEKRKHPLKPTGDYVDAATGDTEFDPDAQDTLDPTGGDLASIDAQVGVAEWVIEAVGDRPIDHLARDLMHGSLLRDRRPRWFHTYCSRPSDWMEGFVGHLSGQARAQALQHVALHFLHKSNLVRLLRPYADTTPAERLNYPEYHRLCRMWACRPHGVLCQRADDDQTAPEQYCGVARLCPWCHTRKAVELYRRISEGPLSKPRGKLLVQARMTMNSADMGLSPEESAHMENVYYPCADAWWHQGNFRNQYRILWPSQVQKMQRASSALLRCAKQAGIQGGLIVCQVGPQRHTEWENSFNLDVSLLGEITYRNQADINVFEQSIGVCHEDGFDDALSREEGECDLNWLVLPAETPNALRFFLAGSHHRYPTGNLDLRAREATLAVLERNGIPGVMSLQPTFMFDHVQWLSCFERLQGIRLFNTFGTWRRGSCRDGRSGRGRGKRRLTDTGKGRSQRRGRVLRAANQTRKVASRARREQLLQVARSLVTEVAVATTGRRGRPAKRQALADALATHGHRATERDLRWLQRELTKGSQPE